MDKERLEFNRKGPVHDFPSSPESYLRLAVRAFQIKDFLTAIDQANKALECGESHAHSLLGLVFEQGSTNVPKNPSKAFEHYQKGIEEVGSQECWLGAARLTYLGLGTAKDSDKAFQQYEFIAAETSHPIAHLMLGKMYLDGEGTHKNLALAEKHLTAAQQEGYIFAYSYLGTLYLRQGKILKCIKNRIIATFKAIQITLTRKNKNLLRRA